MNNFRMVLKVLLAATLVIGLCLAVTGGEKPLPKPASLTGISSQSDNADFALKEELAPVHTEPGEPGVDDPADVTDGPSEEEIEMKYLENLARAKGLHYAADLKANPRQESPGVSVMHPTSELFFQGFESGVPPTGWTTVINNAFTWESGDYAPYEGLYYATCLYDETYTSSQDEWLISPDLDLTTDGIDWYMDFWWNGSYYWSVDPYPNCTLSVMITTDDGSTWDELWNQYDFGVFTDWVWNNTVLDLSAYSMEANVNIAFVYRGYDGAQFSVDAMSINDAAPPVGRCCYGDPAAWDCDDLTADECAALGGIWSQGLNCTDNPCPTAPANDVWEYAESIMGPFPVVVTGSTIGATVDCPGVLDWDAVWYVFEAPYALNDIDIDYCGTVPGLETVGVIVYEDPVVCEDYILRTDYEWWTCADMEDNPHVWWTALPGPATYYLPVYTGDAKGQQDFSFTIDVTETPPPEPGDYCGDPIVLTLGSGDMPYTLTSQYTCGRGNWYENTCMGYYDGGEDIIYELNLTEDLELDITLDPKGTTYTGIMISSDCPDTDGLCIAYDNNSGSGVHGMTHVALTAGTYYIMVDTWPSPDCIPDFDLTIEQSPPPQPGDNCTDPIKVELPAELPFEDLGQYTCGRGDNYYNTCLGSYDEDEDIMYELTVTTTTSINITMDPNGTSGTNGILVSDHCPPDEDCIVYNTIYGATNTIIGLELAPGTYYLMVDHYSGTCLPDFNLYIEEYGGPTPGDNCGDPIVVKLPDDMVSGPDLDSYIDAGQTTCGRVDDYDLTCLGSYDGGEDIIYMLDVGADMTVNIELAPSVGWTGIVLDDNCPPDEGDCIMTSTASSGSHGLYTVELTTGYYYLMIDTWPSPDCIPSFDLTISPGEVVESNDFWQYCEPLSGEVIDLPFTTIGATPDGPGGCLTSPNIWFCYTPDIDGNATFDLCASSYDTKMALYDGPDPFSATQIGCDDDGCPKKSLQSMLVDVPVLAGNTYLVEVGGYSSNTGDGFLNITVESCPPPDNDMCEDVTPVTLSEGTPVTFTGDNHCATHQCDFFDDGHTWHAFTIPSAGNVTLDYCTTSPAFGNAWLNLSIGCPCTDFTVAADFNTSDCGDGNVTMTWNGLAAGTYYYPVMKDPGNGADGPYTLHVVYSTVAEYCDAYGGCDEYISRVAVGVIDNSTGCDGYADHTGLATTMMPGTGYPITVENGNGYGSDICAVWVDWNQDFIFDAAEEAVMDVNTGYGPYTGTVTPPMDATAGPTRMRVRINYYSYPPACGTTTYGEVEDYTVIVGGGTVIDTVLLDPEPIFVFMAYEVNPHSGFVYIGDNFDETYNVADIDAGTVMINGMTPISTAIVSHPNIEGDALAVEFALGPFAAGYGLVWDVTTQSYTVTGDYTGGGSFSVGDDFDYVGHVSGDLNLDNAIDISDLVMMVDWMFTDGEEPYQLACADVNASGGIPDIADLVYLVEYMFKDGPTPMHE